MIDWHISMMLFAFISSKPVKAAVATLTKPLAKIVKEAICINKNLWDDYKHWLNSQIKQKVTKDKN